jgi:toxin-antitoxin system PIN domain toxin
MRALLDVNCLLSLMDEDHVHHRRAQAWWGQNGRFGWASCALTQNGYVRISCQRTYVNPQPLHSAITRLARQIEDSDHQLWPDDISIANASVFDHAFILGPNQITDVYLLALAVKNGGRLVTFDRGLPIKAVRGAEARHLVVL